MAREMVRVTLASGVREKVFGYDMIQLENMVVE
jgi:hypothetical protein